MIKYIIVMWLFRIISILSFIGILGTAGAFEHDLIGMAQFLIQSTVCLLLSVISFKLATNIDEKYN